MKRPLFLTVSMLLVGAGSVHAANFAVIKSPPTMLNVLVLGVAVACVVGTWKVADVIRGGLLARSWKYFMTGFIALVLSQMVKLLEVFEFAVLPEIVVPALQVVAVALLAYAIFETKRTLN